MTLNARQSQDHLTFQYLLIFALNLICIMACEVMNNVPTLLLPYVQFEWKILKNCCLNFFSLVRQKCKWCAWWLSPVFFSKAFTNILYSEGLVNSIKLLGMKRNTLWRTWSLANGLCTVPQFFSCIDQSYQKNRSRASEFYEKVFSITSRSYEARFWYGKNYCLFAIKSIHFTSLPLKCLDATWEK